MPRGASTLALYGCGVKAAGASIGGRLPAAIAASVLVSAGCSAGVPATPTPRTPSFTADLPADQVVLQVVVAGGYTPPVYHALAAPSIAVFGDGRLVLVVAESLAWVRLPTRSRGSHPRRWPSSPPTRRRRD